MPFLPFVLLLAWQAISKSASFALGWATALFFGQVPGRQGRILSVVSLLAAGWLILAAGFGVPLLVGAALDLAGLISRNFSVEPLHVLGLTAGIVAAPPAIAGITVWGEFGEERSWSRWLRLLPTSYPATASLGLSVLLMVVISPVLAIQRLRRKWTVLQVPLMMADETDDDDLVEAVSRALRSIGIEEVAAEEATGPLAWPLRTVAFAAERLLGAMVRGEPMRLSTGELTILVYATAVSLIGPKQEAYRARAAVEREMALATAYLTWSDDSQDLEDELMRAHRRSSGDTDELRRELDRIQERIDTASLNSEEWNILYRLRLQVEQEAQRANVKMAKPATRMKAMKTTSSRAPQLTRRSG